MRGRLRGVQGTLEPTSPPSNSRVVPFRWTRDLVDRRSRKRAGRAPAAALLHRRAHNRQPRQRGRDSINHGKEKECISILEVSARLKVRPGQLEGFKRQAAEIVRLAKERDTGTLRYDWFLSSDGAQCEVREAYVSSDALIEHRMHIGEALDKMFAEFAEDHTVYMFGDVSPKLREIVNVRLAAKVKANFYSFLQGFEPQMTLPSAESTGVTTMA
jgi:quinol monooxygenase YgiN